MSDASRPKQGWTEEQARRLLSARLEADAADTLVREVSTARLAELQRASVSVAMRAFDDPSLTFEDREQLKRHLAKVSRQRKDRGRSAGIRRLRLRLGYRSVFVIATLLVAGTAAFVGWRNTPLGFVTIKTAIALDWHRPGATSQRGVLRPGVDLQVAEQRDATRILRVRRWIDGIGYAEADVPYAALR